MTGYAQLALRAMLSWVKGAAQQLWNVLGSADSGTVTWLLNSWWKVAAAILLVGTAADVLVHLLRWRPLTVYASFFRRLRERDDGDVIVPEPVYAEPEPVPAVAESYPGAAIWNPEQTQPAAAAPAEAEAPAPGRFHRLASHLPQALGLGDADDPLIRYQPPQPTVDIRDAYHEPVYPVVHTPADPENGHRRRRRSQ